MLKKTTKSNIFEINASDKALGRVASEAANILIGKNSPNYQPNILSKNIVMIKNIKQARITGKKLEQKQYYTYSGYPGGIRKFSLNEIFTKNPEKAFKNLIYNMLPNNKHRSILLKNIKFQ